MEELYKPLLYSHIIAGALSLVLFWIPVLVKKGSNIHVKVGWVYTYAMWYVLGSASLLSIINLFDERYLVAAFLGYLALLTGISLWYAITILKYKKGLPPNLFIVKKLLDYLLLAGGVGLLLWAIVLKVENEAILLMIFGIIGVTSAVRSIYFLSESKKGWYSQHMEGMIGTGVAAYTAFFAFGAGTMMPAVFSGRWVIIPWILPAIIGNLIVIRMNRKKVLNTIS